MKNIIFILCLFSTAVCAQNSTQKSASILDTYDYNTVATNNTNPSRGGVEQFCKGNLLLNQVPNQTNGIFNDIDCDFCDGGAGGTQILADNFTLTTDNSISEWVIHSGYFPDNIPLTTDLWTLTIHADNAGVPGAIVFSESNIPSNRTDTGVDLFDVDQYRHVLTLTNPVDLVAGIYWVEIHNNSSENTDSVFWEVADSDTNSLPGSAFAFVYPVVTWSSDPSNNFALQICEESYNIDVNVTGLAATNSVSFANGSDTLTVNADGTNTLSTLAEGSAYNVTITTQPDDPAQVCSVTSGNASGNLAGADVTIDVSCQYTVSVDVSGLANGNTVTLQNNGGDDLNAGNGISTFNTALNDGDTYFVSVLNQPTTPSQTCVVSSPIGSVSGNNIELTVACTTDMFDVNINVTGLAATNSVSFTNDLDTLTISANGSQTISTLLDESAYDVDITSQPDTPNQVCDFDDADSGSVAGDDVTINVSCVTVQYDIRVGVTGLAAGNSVVLQNNGGDDLNASNGINTFSTPIDDGTTYNVTVTTQPTTPNQTCVVNGASGTVSGADVNTITVSCTTDTYFIGGDVTGLLNNSVLVLDLNNQESEVVTCNGPFVFDTPLPDESSYSVTVMMNPDSPLQTCEVTMGNGTLNGDDIIDVDVMCEFMTDMDYIFGDGFDGSPFCVPEQP